jgi:ubiquinone/menaquinone biosynthesis C-methylase UbiE
MITRRKPRRHDEPRREKRSKSKPLHRLVEYDLMRRVSYAEYQDEVRRVYDGPQGAMLLAFSLLSGHISLGERLLKTRRFDLRGVRDILDIGSGAGQIARHLLKYADPGASITCIDLSLKMLRRARSRLKSGIPRHVAADLSRLPFADGSFDAATCGYVLEYVPDARTGLAEISRVLRPGGRLMLLATEDSFSGVCTSRVWRCRTYNRQELRRTCNELGLIWKQDLWFTRMHRVFKAGGICVEIEKRA